MTAAQTLRLVEEGAIALDHPAAYLPPKLDGTIRDVLGMRSGIVDNENHVQSVDEGANIPELVEMLPGWGEARLHEPVR